MNFEDYSADEICQNAANLRYISLEYLNKLLVLIQNYNRTGKEQIRIDVGEIFYNLLEHDCNIKILKRMNKII